MQDNQSVTFRSTNAQYQFLPGNILKVSHHGFDNNFESTDEELNKIKSKLNHRKHKIVFNNEGFKYSGKKVRLISLNRLDDIAHALAFVSKSKTAYGLASIFVALSRTQCPIRIFKNEADALSWLDQF